MVLIKRNHAVFKLLQTTFLILLPQVSFVLSITDECGLIINECPLEKYEEIRSISGECNNLNNYNWGTIHCTYDRILKPKYGPNGSLPIAKSKKPLPNARTLSSNIFIDNTVPDKLFSLALMAYGQIVAHDLSFNELGGPPSSCCTPDYQIVDSPKCASIKVPATDMDFPLANISCISLLKTFTNKDLNCSTYLKYIEQISETNAYLDMSLIYGATDDIAKSLRTFTGGTLLGETRGGFEWLPKSEGNRNCGGPLINPAERCYKTGDGRLNQNPGLCIFHIVWMREHNRVARELSILNPHWDDERLFQEARLIVICQHQYITYYEMLPWYLGRQNLIDNKIIFETDGFVNDYDPNMRPHVFNENAQAAFRKFHSMVQGHLELINEAGCPFRNINLRDTFLRPHLIEDNYDDLCRGMSFQPSIESDRFIVPEMTKFFVLRQRKLATDIKSVDIQRARNHGLASYNDMRQFCGLRKAKHFNQFTDVMEQDVVDLLQRFYEHVDDVELLVAGSLENNVNGTLVGPTFLCIMLKQFHRTRTSDRFWFENSNSGLTLNQLKQIRKASISKILCDNSNEIGSLQQQGFLQVSKTNSRIPCDKMDGPNLNYWKEVSGTENLHYRNRKFTLTIP